MQELYLSKASKVLVSMYDGPEQIEKFNKMTKQANVPEDFIILRDRWYDKYNDFGVKLTNRAGTIEVGDQSEVKLNKDCFYPTYQFLMIGMEYIFVSARLAKGFHGECYARKHIRNLDRKNFNQV